jgi:hypothetical protein
MVAWGISTDDKDRIALVEILEDHSGCAGPEGGLQSYAAGLVAVVTAVVDVVGPIDSGKKLEQKKSIFLTTHRELVSSAATAFRVVACGELTCLQKMIL